MEEKRYYYKDKQGNHYNYKSEHTEEYLIPITKEEFNELSNKRYEPTEEQKAKIEKTRQIAELKKKLADTDYIVLKIAEAQADGDTETVAELKITYATELANRKAWREQVDELEN